MAGIFDRMAMIAKANVNDLIDKFEDPEKMIDQAIMDATEEYAKMKKQSLNVVANETQAKKQLDELRADAEKWHKIATNALKAGNEDDAKTALVKENGFLVRAATQEKTYEAAKAAADKLRAKLRKIEDKINEMKNKSAQIKATSATAKATKAANQISSRGLSRGGFEAFQRMEEKAEKELAEAEAMESLNESADAEEESLEKKYADGGPASVDKSLAKLKEELGMK